MTFREALQQADTPFLLETTRQQANSLAQANHDPLADLLRELADRLEAATK